MFHDTVYDSKEQLNKFCKVFQRVFLNGGHKTATFYEHFLTIRQNNAHTTIQ